MFILRVVDVQCAPLMRRTSFKVCDDGKSEGLLSLGLGESENFRGLSASIALQRRLLAVGLTVMQLCDEQRC